MSALPVAVSATHLRPSSRYRHPGDVIRLISAGIVLACSATASWVAFRWLLGPAAPVLDGLGSGAAGRVAIGLVQVACVAAAVLVVAATLGRRRFRLLGGLTAGAAAAAAAAAGIFYLLGGLAADAFRDVVEEQEVPDCLTRPSS